MSLVGPLNYIELVGSIILLSEASSSHKQKIMLIFSDIKMSLIYLGLLDSEHLYKQQIRKFLAILAISIQVSALFSSIWFFMYEAASFDEYAAIVPVINGFVYAFTEYILIMTQYEKLIEITQNLSSMIDKRMLRAEQILTTTNHRVDKVSRGTLIILIGILIPCFIAIPFLQSYYAYLVEKKMAENAFHLPQLAS